MGKLLTGLTGIKRSDYAQWAVSRGEREFIAVGRGRWFMPPGDTLTIDVFVFGRWFSFDLHIGALITAHGKYVQKPNGDIELVE